MATQSALLTELKELSGVLTEESISDSRLDSVLDRALAEHNQNYSYASLPVAEEELVIILAWITICDIRASSASLDPDSSGGSFSPGGSKFSRNQKMARHLRERYILRSKSLDIVVGSSSIVVTTTVILDDEIDAHTPVSQSSLVTNLKLTITETSPTTSAIAAWTYGGLETFQDLYLYHKESASIYEAWNTASSTGVPRVNDSAVRLYTTSNYDIEQIKVNDLDRAVDNHFLLIARSKAGRYSYSSGVNLVSS